MLSRIETKSSSGSGGGFQRQAGAARVPVVHLVKPRQLAEVLAERPGVLVIDVRGPEERLKAVFPGAVGLCHELKDALCSGDVTRPLAFVCHRGVRSRFAARVFAAYGFREVYSLVGGIDAWALDVDPSVPRYGRASVCDDDD